MKFQRIENGEKVNLEVKNGHLKGIIAGVYEDSISLFCNETVFRVKRGDMSLRSRSLFWLDDFLEYRKSVGSGPAPR
jgi:hypothetical protein